MATESTASGASMMTPLARLVLIRTTPRTELVSAMAWLTVPALIGPLTGPLIGGFLTTYLSWHWIFWINVPIGLIGFLLVAWKIPAIPATNPGKPDILGLALVGLALALGMFGLETVGRHVVAEPWPGVALAAGFVVRAVGGGDLDDIGDALLAEHMGQHPRRRHLHQAGPALVGIVLAALDPGLGHVAGDGVIVEGGGVHGRLFSGRRSS